MISLLLANQIHWNAPMAWLQPVKHSQSSAFPTNLTNVRVLQPPSLSWALKSTLLRCSSACQQINYTAWANWSGSGEVEKAVKKGSCSPSLAPSNMQQKWWSLAGPSFGGWSNSPPFESIMDAYIRINQEFRSDLEWWYQMVATWNGVSILAPLKAEAPDCLITTDASGGWGCGGFFDNKWFQMEWDPHTTPLHITIKELLPVVIATAVWGRNWAGKTIRALCDNMAVVHIIQTRQSKEPNAMHLLRCLALIECSFQFSLVSRHIPGRHNDLADALSRDNLPHFLAHHPQAQSTPTPIPASLYEALVSQKPNWTSTAWASQFGNIISRV